MRLLWLAMGLLFTFHGLLHAQASSTAEQGLRLYGYGTGNWVRPLSTGGFTNHGATAGATLNAFAFGRTELGLDVRWLGSSGPLYREFVLSGGPRLQFNAGRFQPYTAFHLGLGTFHFNQPTDPSYTSDRSTVYNFAGGVDYRLTRSWSLRTEADWQRWRLGSEVPAFSPLSVGVGVRYQFHFRSQHGAE